jgi:hypothetical protein
VATTGAARAKEKTLPRSRTIHIRDQKPKPAGEVEVTPDGGRIHFRNTDAKDYRLRFQRVSTAGDEGIDMLLPANGSLTVLIKKKDEFHFTVLHIAGSNAANGQGGGPIRN